jgi:mono/diheme cytochrome c family protein
MRKLLATLLVVSSPSLVSAEQGKYDGQAIYADNCASCHGENLEGQENWRTLNDDGTLPAPPHDETGHTWHHDNEMLFLYTKLGGAEYLKQKGLAGFASAMPGFKDALTDPEILAVLDFIKSTWPQDIQDGQAERSRQKDQ